MPSFLANKIYTKTAWDAVFWNWNLVWTQYLNVYGDISLLHNDKPEGREKQRIRTTQAKFWISFFLNKIGKHVQLIFQEDKSSCQKTTHYNNLF